MELKQIIEYFPENQSFTKQQFVAAVREENAYYADSSISWLLAELKKENKIISVGKGRYVRTSSRTEKREYRYLHQKDYMEVESMIAKEFPLVEFQMWELYQMNEFVNHLFGKNTIFVEVENMCEDVVFECLRNRFADVLFCPNKEMYYKLRKGDGTIVVQKLISETPGSIEGHSAPIEKILVDLFSGKLTGKLISKSEYRDIYEEAFDRYDIDEQKMFRYARRRNLETKIKKFIQEETDIQLKYV